MLINGQKISNCITDSNTSNNIFPSLVAKSLGLNLTNNFGKFYSMDGKKVPLIGQVKDAKAVLVAYHDKRLKLTILVFEIAASYVILLSQIFCKDMGREIKMDWSKEMILTNDKKKLVGSESEE